MLRRTVNEKWIELCFQIIKVNADFRIRKEMMAIDLPKPPLKTPVSLIKQSKNSYISLYLPTISKSFHSYDMQNTSRYTETIHMHDKVCDYSVVTCELKVKGIASPYLCLLKSWEN